MSRSSVRVFALLAAISLPVACGEATAADLRPSHGPRGVVAVSAGSGRHPFPETCLDVQENLDDAGDARADGLYHLYFDGNEAQPWTAYCRGMKWEDPDTYLEVAAESNFSEARDSLGRSRRTVYSKIRVHLGRFELDPTEDFFSRKTSSANADSMADPWGPRDDRDPYVPLGVADSLDGFPAHAQIDLRGTGFVFAAGVSFCVNGNGTESGAVFSADRTRVVLIASDTTHRRRATVSNACHDRATVDSMSVPLLLEYDAS